MYFYFRSLIVIKVRLQGILEEHLLYALRRISKASFVDRCMVREIASLFSKDCRANISNADRSRSVEI
jgi:hypothetical protein